MIQHYTYPGKPRLLIVDDDTINRRLTTVIFEQDGYEVKECDNGAAALTLAQSFQPDLILLDVVMPEMGGLETCRKLKACPDTTDIPIVFLTSYSSQEQMIEGLQAGGSDYLSKPFNKTEMLLRAKHHVQLRHYQKHLKELNQNQQAFFVILAHDLKGVFTGAIGRQMELERKIADVDLPSDIPPTLKRMHSELHNGLRFLSELLDWGKIQMVTLAFNPEEIFLHDLVLEASATAEGTLTSKRIELHHDYPEDYKVFGDADMIKTILRNLITNACKYSPEGSRITVQLKAGKEGDAISVEDQGPGIEPEVARHLFKINSRLIRRENRNKNSTGMGLILCDAMIKRHRGWIRADAGTHGGARITFFLPRMTQN